MRRKFSRFVLWTVLGLSTTPGVPEHIESFHAIVDELGLEGSPCCDRRCACAAQHAIAAIAIGNHGRSQRLRCERERLESHRQLPRLWLSRFGISRNELRQRRQFARLRSTASIDLAGLSHGALQHGFASWRGRSRCGVAGLRSDDDQFTRLRRGKLRFPRLWLGRTERTELWCVEIGCGGGRWHGRLGVPEHATPDGRLSTDIEYGRLSRRHDAGWADEFSLSSSWCGIRERRQHGRWFG